AGLEDAVRDRFARATVSPLSITNLTSPIANWLPGAGFQFADVSELTPQLTFEPPDTQSSMTARPKVKFSWKNAPGELIGQDLELSASPPVGQDAKTQDWMTAWLRWTDEKNLERPVLRVDVDGRAGSRRAANSAIPLLEHRTPITAVSAGWLAGRMWVIFAVESEKEKLFAWSWRSSRVPLAISFDLAQERMDRLEMLPNCWFRFHKIKSSL
ncbi:MAG: hypothetical protein NT069_21730, partial [Planctomycetota bacterium]|nr:hypothetical protein [Planctomycetota bacterium]